MAFSKTALSKLSLPKQEKIKEIHEQNGLAFHKGLQKYNNNAKKDLDEKKSKKSYLTIFKTLFSDSKRIVDLGIGYGLDERGLSGWEVTGYENDEEVVKYLQAEKLFKAVHPVNLNSTIEVRDSADKPKKELSYRPKLAADLKEVCNIVSIRTLEYLEYEALCLLLFDLFDLAQIGSRILLVYSVTPEEPTYRFSDDVYHKPELLIDDKVQKKLGVFKPNFPLSFLGGRLDWEREVVTSEQEKEVGEMPQSKDLEVLLFRKRRCD